ncbi:MAG: hypothetical protein EBZ13_08750, partial [Planctomycetia bacterium]|nr:hypothetical protein [Planctomycetia bacterium]
MYFYAAGDDGVIGTGDANETAYAFVMNPAYFSSGNDYRTSSDPVDTALNSFINPNSPPAMANDLLEVPEDTTGTGNVLANDSDPDNNVLTVESYTIGGTTGTLGSPTVIPGVGSFTLNADGLYSFTPEQDYTGPVPTVNYTASDGNGGTASATLSIVITPANDPPTTTDDSVTTLVDTPIALQLSDFGSYADPEGDPLASIEVTSVETAGSLEYFNGTAWT